MGNATLNLLSKGKLHSEHSVHSEQHLKSGWVFFCLFLRILFKSEPMSLALRAPWEAQAPREGHTDAKGWLALPSGTTPHSHSPHPRPQLSQPTSQPGWGTRLRQRLPPFHVPMVLCPSCRVRSHESGEDTLQTPPPSAGRRKAMMNFT